MEGSKLLNTLFYEFPSCQKLYVFKAPDFYIVFGLVSKSIYVAKFSHEEVTKKDITRKKYEGEVKMYITSFLSMKLNLVYVIVL